MTSAALLFCSHFIWGAPFLASFARSGLLHSVSLNSREGQSPEPAQSAALPAARQQTYVGMVTCSRCLAKHSAKIGATATDCARVCIRDGAKFALVDGDQTYLLEGDPVALKRVAAERVRVVGACNGETITVASVAAGT
jgi:hypothetical protein